MQQSWPHTLTSWNPQDYRNHPPGHTGLSVKMDENMKSKIQWNLDLTKSRGTVRIGSLNRGFLISKTSI